MINSNATEQPRSEGADRPSQSVQSFFDYLKLEAIPTLGLAAVTTTKASSADTGGSCAFGERGKLRGVTLVPYDAVSAFVRSKMEAT